MGQNRLLRPWHRSTCLPPGPGQVPNQRRTLCQHPHPPTGVHGPLEEGQRMAAPLARCSCQLRALAKGGPLSSIPHHMPTSQVLCTPRSSSSRAERDAESLRPTKPPCCALLPAGPPTLNPYEPPKAHGGQCSEHPAARWQELVGAEEQESDGEGQRGAAKELHKVPVKQLTPEIGEEITRTTPQLRAKGEDARGDTPPPPPPVSAACAQADARAAGGRAAWASRGDVSPQRLQLPLRLACPLARARPRGRWLPLHSRHYCPE